MLGQRIGAYTIVGELGEGGFGTVYLAEQSEPIRRRVALKILKAGLGSTEIVRRFEAERQALAVMEHPSIAKVFDAGTTPTGQPFFVMEFVEGLSITKHCDERALGTRERLALFQQVCRGVQHAHQKGVIHRDIKPSNVLVTTVDGQPLPKIIDFGIAKALGSKLSEQSIVTELRQILGTPEYMAPEQADGRGDIDTRADVYSLGVLLYQLLTGTKPFEVKALVDSGIGELLKHIREVVPPKPSTRVSTLGESITTVATRRSVTPERLVRSLRGELDWIVMKAVEKERERRYAATSELGDDVGRYLADQPVLAGPPSALYRFGKFARRNKIWLVAGVVVASSLVAATAVLAWSLQRVRAQRDIAELARANAEASLDESDAVTDFLAEMLGSLDPRRDGRDVSVRKLLDRASLDVGERFAGRPRAETRLRRTIGDAYRHLGLLEQAESHVPQALELARRTLPADDPRTLDALESLCALRVDQSRYPEAEALAAELEQRARAAGGDEGAVGTALARKAYTQSLDGRFDEAEANFRAALAMLEKRFGPDGVETLACLNNLQNLLWSLSRYEEAQPIVSRIAETRIRVLGPEHPDTLNARSNRAAAWKRQGRRDESLAEYRDVLQARRRVLGDDSLETLASIRALSEELRDRALYEEAEPLARESVERSARMLGAENAETVHALRQLGLLLWQSGRPAEAEEPLLRAVDGATKGMGPTHPDTLDVRNVLAIVHYVVGRVDEAREEWEALLPLHAERFGEDNATTNMTRGNIAMTYEALGRYGEAEELYLSNLDSLRRSLGPDDAATQDTLNNLGVLYERLGRHEEAERYLSEVVEIRTRVLGPHHPLTLETRGNLGLVEMEAGRYDDALRTLEAVLEGQRAASGAESVPAATTLTMLGRLHWSMRDLEEAERCFRGALAIYEKSTGVPEATLAGTSQQLGVILRDRGQPAEAERLFARALEIQKRVLGPRHRETLRTQATLVNVLGVLGREEQARPVAIELIAGLDEYARSDDATADVLDVFGRLLLSVRPADLRDAKRALAVARRVSEMTGDSDPGYLRTLARALRATGAEDEALEVAQRVLDAELDGGGFGRTVEDVLADEE